MTHRTTRAFWTLYRALPAEVQKLADEQYQLMRANPRHPSVRLKKVGPYWSARVGIHYRAVATQENGDLVWFWIGHHHEFDKIV